MNILIILSKNKKKDSSIINSIDKKNNNIFFLEQNENFFKKILRLKKENKINVILNLNENNELLLKMTSIFFKIPIVVYLEDIDIEKELQRKIAYKHQRDIPVLMYHRVITAEEEKGTYDTYVTKENFEKQMRYIKENGYEVINFYDIENGEFKRRFDENKKYVIITFDDGYKDNLINALPILKKFNLKAVLFFITDISYNKWDIDVENRPKEKDFKLMNLEEIKEFYASGLIEIGGHTTSHLDMPTIDDYILKKDLEISKKKIEKITGKKAISFAYPWGRNNEKSRKLVKDVGYQFAVSTESGSPCFSDNLFEIQRVGIYSKDDMEKFKKKLSGNYPFMRENRAKLKKIRNKLRKIVGLKTK